MSEGLAKKLAEFVEAGGAEILKTTNPWEMVRFKTVRGTHIVYNNARGRVRFSCSNAEEAYHAFQNGKKWVASDPVKRTQRKKVETQLLERDGDRCFYCNCPFTDADPATLEHLLSVSSGGNNHLDNLALAHEDCNRAAANLSIVGKMRVRDRLLLIHEGVANAE